jgi:hypothetical protein
MATLHPCQTGSACGARPAGFRLRRVASDFGGRLALRDFAYGVRFTGFAAASASRAQHPAWRFVGFARGGCFSSFACGGASRGFACGDRSRGVGSGEAMKWH